MAQYLLIKSDEDGDPNMFFDGDVNAFLECCTDDYSVTDFFTEIPDETDAVYWPEGVALLLEIKVLKPQVKTTSYKL